MTAPTSGKSAQKPTTGTTSGIHAQTTTTEASGNALALLILEQWETERDQLQALLYAIESQLRPDPTCPDEEINITGWRLAQLGYDMLSDCACLYAWRDAAEKAEA
ncbi:MAG: D-(-)-3-hydroxybutyrate oligomer hydrolase [Rhodoferax sp.]|nr:D-(-)-3-hydroxybutyrate oligomer hydrolase [Rhodoferax sp.]